MRLLILTADEVRAALPMPDAIEAMRSAFAQHARGEALVPQRSHLEVHGGAMLVMPGYLAGDGALGAKLVSVFSANGRRGIPVVNALMLLLDAETGVPRALLEGGALTAIRTGAATGLATALLARDDARVLTVFGAGRQARTQIEAVRAVRPIEAVRVVTRTATSAARLVEELDLPAQVLRNPNDALRGADIVVTATTSATPVFDGNAVEEGTHVNGVGSYSAEMAEVDEALVRRALVVVDSREAALAEAGDLIQPLRAGRPGNGIIACTLGELITGAAAGRTAPDQITFFKSVGIAAQDLAAAARAVDVAERAGLGRVVEL